MGEPTIDRQFKGTFTQGFPQKYEGIAFYGVSGSDCVLHRSDPDDLHLAIGKVGLVGVCVVPHHVSGVRCSLATEIMTKRDITGGRTPHPCIKAQTILNKGMWIARL